MKYYKVLIYGLLGILIFSIGILAGIQIGTYAVIDHVAYGLAGSTFIVNLNETKLMEEFNKTIIPQIKSLGEKHDK
jgi:hypothetical protein